ncbi:MAG: hypothetical protein ABIP17_02345 [Ilumatobacteraceae bacterium]
MADIRRTIGLSLGADLCWPTCYEHVLERLDLTVQHGGDSIRFDVERVTIEPFFLRQPVKYDLVVDRLTHWYGTSREWIKKAILMNDLYVFNNPWSIQSNEKHTSYCAMMRLGMPIPATWMVPPKAYEPSPDLQVTLERYATLFDLHGLGDEVGYPMFMKPYDGGGWAGVSRIDDVDELQRVYDDSGTYLMHLQRAVDPHDLFIRCVGLGPQVRVIRYDAGAPLHDRYTSDDGDLPEEQRRHLVDTTLTINSFFGWDFNSCEALRQGGDWFPIDFANPCPDSQVTSLHYHFPWLIGANLRWSLFCATTKRPMRPNLDWQPYFDIADTDATYDEKLAGYAAIARERLQVAEFDEFCSEHLGDLDRVLWEFFGTDTAREAIRQKVAAMYPDHEVDEFTELFWSRIQQWRNDNAIVTAS